ncbi:MAG: hypothetical protein COX39_00800 [Candidatus Nealsonbacteria bacterium CG23_combo_of_CG06-09_8_20_14_all_40_13]|uniref:Uncharacterized protein n=1 Tax=Candidatus Nealsonbacteria bacterium CG23_combo_of_CG06-09_8_20_14_all_40_13 TaxID=1974724 RepID=A0A2G9YRK4_9BACT|nr:MAG: hypothetical protein COX39_00800 [Candidatus Nealsonbacteria bacterium CG23_combo_of_CG06-09_8_20_14_all_40_13]
MQLSEPVAEAKRVLKNRSETPAYKVGWQPHRKTEQQRGRSCKRDNFWGAASDYLESHFSKSE